MRPTGRTLSGGSVPPAGDRRLALGTVALRPRRPQLGLLLADLDRESLERLGRALRADAVLPTTERVWPASVPLARSHSAVGTRLIPPASSAMSPLWTGWRYRVSRLLDGRTTLMSTASARTSSDGVTVPRSIPRSDGPGLSCRRRGRLTTVTPLATADESAQPWPSETIRWNYADSGEPSSMRTLWVTRHHAKRVMSVRLATDLRRAPSVRRRRTALPWCFRPPPTAEIAEYAASRKGQARSVSPRLLARAM
jgi:hypothetical protein